MTADDPTLGSRNEAKRERRAQAKVERERGARRRRSMARARTAAIGVVGLVIVVALALALVRDVSPGGVEFAGELRRGGTIERLTLPALEEGSAFTYSEVADRPLVINFFASWCPSCVAEMPDFERVHQDVGHRVAFLGVSQSDARDASIDLARGTGITYDTAIDQNGRFFNALGAQGMPTTVFVRPGGEIADIWVGALDAASLTELVHQHFGSVFAAGDVRDGSTKQLGAAIGEGITGLMMAREHLHRLGDVPAHVV